MPNFIDARLTLLFGKPEDAGPDDALLLEGEGTPSHGRDWFQAETAPGHPTACPCCTPRNSAGMALSRLLLARARGAGLFFNRVVAVTNTQAGRDAVAEALASDPLASSCFKL